MKVPAAIPLAAMALTASLTGPAWAGGHHWHEAGNAAVRGEGGEHAHAPVGPAPAAPAPQAGGRWHDAVPGATHDAHVADRDHGGDHVHGGDHGHGGEHGHWGGDHDWDHHHWEHDWGHGDIRYFHYYDWDAWHGGYWDHGWYGPRFGWWWVVSGVWFFYPAPVYPYPNPYVPSDWVAPPPPPAQAAGQFWYFCPAQDAYYPYVPSCPTGWQQVPANADPAPQPPPPGG